jgi:hypothetical protein
MTDNQNTITLPTTIRVLLPNHQVEEIKLETYLAGVVAAEIGADAPLEALKAQAVAARTYAVAAPRHPEQNADVCTTEHCQRWKRVDPISAPEVFRAVSETWGIVAMYDGQLIRAFFFEHCDGHTRNAEEMHVPATPYLRGVDCPCGFLTLKGHGVGMCKRGAIVMARRNASFEQILQHYYRGVSIVRTELEMPSEQDLTPPPVETPFAPKPRARSRQPKAPTPDSAKPKRRTTRRVLARVSEPEPTPRPIIEITAVPASVALKRVQLPESPSAPLPSETSAPASAAPDESKTETPSAPLVVPGAPKIEEESAPPTPPRIELDFPVRPREPSETETPIETWRLPKPEPIETTPAPVPAAPMMVDETPSMIGRRVQVDHLPGARMICGALPRANVVVMIENPHGETFIVYSGTAPHYGEGGFEVVVPEDGKYIVTIGGQTIGVNVQDDTVFIHA